MTLMWGHIYEEGVNLSLLLLSITLYPADFFFFLYFLACVLIFKPRASPDFYFIFQIILFVLFQPHPSLFAHSMLGFLGSSRLLCLLSVVPSIGSFCFIITWTQKEHRCIILYKLSNIPTWVYERSDQMQERWKPSPKSLSPPSFSLRTRIQQLVPVSHAYSTGSVSVNTPKVPLLIFPSLALTTGVINVSPCLTSQIDSVLLPTTQL